VSVVLILSSFLGGGVTLRLTGLYPGYIPAIQ
jgi:hypothetical protein